MSALVLPGLRVEGSSRAGEATWFRVHPPGLAFDVGRGEARLAGAADLFVTHGHLDHALGVPFVLSHRTLHRSGPTRVFCPRALREALARLVDAASVMEAARYDWELRGLAAGDRVAVGRDLLVEAFAVPHGVPALGYHLLRRKGLLRDTLRGLPGEEIAARRRRGERVETMVEEVLVSYPGDTGAAVFAHEPRLATARVLLLECTFAAPGFLERAHRYGHLCFEDLCRLAPALGNEAVVLHHLSRRHSPSELRRRVAEELTALAPRVWVADEAGIAPVLERGPQPASPPGETHDGEAGGTRRGEAGRLTRAPEGDP